MALGSSPLVGPRTSCHKVARVVAGLLAALSLCASPRGIKSHSVASFVEKNRRLGKKNQEEPSGALTKEKVAHSHSVSRSSPSPTMKLFHQPTWPRCFEHCGKAEKRRKTRHRLQQPSAQRVAIVISLATANFIAEESAHRRRVPSPQLLSYLLWIEVFLRGRRGRRSRREPS